jgi:hypothetical protein
MHKTLYLFSILLFLISTSTYGQEEKEVKKIDGYIVDIKNDTLRCEFLGISNPFKRDLLNPAAVCSKKIRVKLENGETYDYKPFELTSIHIFFNKNNYYMPGFPVKMDKMMEVKFVGIKEDNYKYFYREIIVGRISVYHKYNQDMRANLLTKEVFVKNDEIQKISIIDYRDDIGSIIIDYPELFKLWIDGNKNYKLHQSINVIELYNEHFKNIQK